MVTFVTALMLAVFAGESANDENSKLETVVGIVRAAWTEDGSLGSVSLATMSGESEQSYPITLDAAARLLGKNRDGQRVAILTPSRLEKGKTLTVRRHFDVITGRLETLEANSEAETRLVLRVSDGEEEPAAVYSLELDETAAQMRAFSGQRVQVIGSVIDGEGQPRIKVQQFSAVVRGSIHMSEGVSELTLAKALATGQRKLKLVNGSDRESVPSQATSDWVEVIGSVSVEKSELVIDRVVRVYRGTLKVSKDEAGAVIAAALRSTGESKPVLLELDRRGTAAAESLAGTAVELTGVIDVRDDQQWITVKTFHRSGATD